MAEATAAHRVRLKAEEVRITWGKPVAELMVPLKETPGPLEAMPWRDSDHHSYEGMPRRGTAEALLESWLIFSGRVRREIRDWALVLRGREVLQKG